jgi:hypothetical protein
MSLDGSSWPSLGLGSEAISWLPGVDPETRRRRADARQWIGFTGVVVAMGDTSIFDLSTPWGYNDHVRKGTTRDRCTRNADMHVIQQVRDSTPRYSFTLAAGALSKQSMRHDIWPAPGTLPSWVTPAWPVSSYAQPWKTRRDCAHTRDSGSADPLRHELPPANLRPDHSGVDFLQNAAQLDARHNHRFRSCTSHASQSSIY